MKFRLIRSVKAVRFDRKVSYYQPGKIIVQIKPHDAWESKRGNLIGCGIDNLLAENRVAPVDAEAKLVVKRYNRWKEFRKNNPDSLSSYAIYGGFGYNLLKRNYLSKRK